ncbi:hypothetical protein FOMPIDRAFT_1147454 [Fomitopsis schrenkii]|uniref:Uncharacterized protein n=1 Tax=Fomitopsis schrenkii TaxID=2126942 RepID=S8E7L8_FOMSC|nr:hypothetical protein FOMPIDRAFT_1147454 [Fomitopsis schrenkii]
MSHHRIVWKRFLLKSGVPIHPLPPTSRHSLPNLSGLDAERLLLRATSLEKNWSSPNTRIIDSWGFTSFYTVFSMTTVPGGQYLIASVGTSTGTSGDRYVDYSLVVYVMDHPLGGAHAIARTRTRTKAYHLKARYTTIRGRRCIAIAYVRRDWGRRGDRENPNHPVDVSLWSGDHEIDAPIPIKYECVALEVPLECLETLSDPRLVPGTPEWIAHAQAQPKPFRYLTIVRTRSQLMYPDIDELFGKPYLAVVQRPNSIVFHNLEGGPSGKLTCPVPELPQQHLTAKIFNIRLLPIDNAVLVVRRLDGYTRGSYCKTMLEMYHAIPTDAPTPAGGKREWTRQPFEWEELESHDFIDCTISDHGIPTRLDDSALPELYSAIDSMVPRPLTLFLRTGRDADLHRWVMFPERREAAPPPSPDAHKSAARHAQTYGAWHYRFDHIHETILTKAGTGAELRAHRALPGSLRSIIYSVPKEDITDAPPVRAIGRQWCRHSQSLAAAMPLFEEQAENGVQDTPNTFAWVDLPRGLDFGDVGCMLWDETIGRLFLASKTLEEVYVLDFAKQPRLGRTLQRESPVSFQISPDPDKILAPLPVARPFSPVARVDLAALSFPTSDNDIAMQNA